MTTPHAITEVERLLTPDQRRPLGADRPQAITIEDHRRFRESIAHRPVVDPIDELVEDLRRIEIENSNNPRRL